VVNEDGGVPGAGALPDLPLLRVEVPPTIQALKAESPEEARAWRAGTRRAFQHYLGRGYRVACFEREPGGGRCFYGLARGEGGAA
jgi:predicted GNAT superfamily acetyltransferase